MPVPMALRRIIVNEIGEQQQILLRELDGDRKFTIVIGLFEATRIQHGVKKAPAQRPLTHDLIVNLVNELGGELQDVMVTDLKDHTYFAKLRVRRDGELVEVDCRPSDAIAVAATADLPIYVEERVLEAASEE